MTAFLLDERAGDSLVLFERVSLTAANGHSERWLQERLFASPALLPMVEMFGYGESFVPLCRELTLRYGSSNVLLATARCFGHGTPCSRRASCGATLKRGAKSSHNCLNTRRSCRSGRIPTWKHALKKRAD